MTLGFRETHSHILNIGGDTAIKEGTSRRHPLANCPEESRHSNPGEAEQIGPDTTSSSADEISKYLTQQGAKSAKRASRGPTASLTALQSPDPVTLLLPELRGYAAKSLASATTRSAGRPSPICRTPPASLARMIRSSLPTKSLPGPRGGRGAVCLPRLFGAATTNSPTPIARR